MGQSFGTNPETDLLEPYKIHLLDKHVILKERQLVQGWRGLKQIAKGIDDDELDVMGTISEVVKSGLVVQPVFYKKPLNEARLISLIDNKGSMIAFRGMTNALIQSAKKEAAIKNTSYYFRSLPARNPENTDFYIYNAASHTDYTLLLKEVKKNIYHRRNLAILIISDAGAARGQLDVDRVNETIIILQLLKQYCFKIAWLNPVPRDRWGGTSASLIENFVPMFEASKEGLKSAVKILRGKVKATGKLFFKKSPEK